MRVEIELTDRQKERLKAIQRQYNNRELSYLLDEVFDIVFRTHLNQYIDGELDGFEESLGMTIKGRVMGDTAWMRGGKNERMD